MQIFVKSALESAFVLHGVVLLWLTVLLLPVPLSLLALVLLYSPHG